MILRVTLAVAYLLVWPTVPDRSKVMIQTKRGYPGSPGWGVFGVGMITPSNTNIFCEEASKIGSRKEKTETTQNEQGRRQSQYRPNSGGQFWKKLRSTNNCNL